MYTRPLKEDPNDGAGDVDEDHDGDEDEDEVTRVGDDHAPRVDVRRRRPAQLVAVGAEVVSARN